MSRTFTIHTGSGELQFSDRDLPLVIGRAGDAHIPLDSGPDVLGYIGDSRGHLFLQPAAGTSDLFHNNRRLATSEWIKSNDITRYGPCRLHYHISGDRVDILITAADETISSLADTFPGKPGSVDTPGAAPESVSAPGSRAFLYSAGGLLFLLLVLAALFVLTAEPLEIEITPDPDSLSVKGFPPAVRIGNHFLGLPGEYEVRAAKEGFRSLAAPVAIRSGEGADRYAFRLEKLPGLVSFYSQPEGAEIFIAGSLLGETPIPDAELAAGRHELRILKDRYMDLEREITIEGLGRKQRFDFTLDPAWSGVTLTSEPAGATVILDGMNKGKTPLTLDILAGSHSLVFEKESYTPHESELQIPAGKELAPPPAVLVPAPATLELASNPGGAAVLVDSVYRGQAPLVVPLSSREEHELLLSLPGHESVRRQITMAEGKREKVTIELPPEYGTLFLAAEPPDAELSIDGRHHGKATGRVRLAVRQHTLEISSPGYRSHTLTVTPAPEYSRHLEIRLEPEQPAGHGGRLTREQTTAGGPEMILLPPAEFTMGSSGREPGRRANEHLRPVKITRPFYLAAREVTNGEFRRFRSGHSSGAASGLSLDGENQPAVNVSWEDAVRYLNWLSRQEGLEPFYREENGRFVPVQPPTAGYRLPFEAEWAYAARYAGRPKPARYPWAGTYPPPPGSGNYADESARNILPVVISGYTDSYPVTAPAGSFPADAGGFFDLGGNASEWCHDFYTPYISLAGGVITDPMGAETGVHHVLRGASWRDASITELRLSYRSYGNRALDDAGFRAARFAP